MLCLWSLLFFYLSLEIVLGQTDSPSCSPPNVTKTLESSLHLSLSCPSEFSNTSRCRLVNYSVMFRQNLSDTDSNQEDFAVRNTPVTTFVLDGLIPYTTYEIKVKSNYGQECKEYSVSSSPSVIAITSPAGPMPPRDVRLDNVAATTVRLVWDAPAYMNGTLKKYRVDFYNSTKQNYKKFTKVTSVTLSHLRPFTKYNVTVRGLASVGDTEYMGQKSQAVSFTTRQSNPSSPRDVRVRKGSVTSTSGLIRWQRPRSPNGVISFYFVGWSQDLSLNATSTTVYVNRKTTEIMLTGLKPFTKCSVWVYAANEESTKRLWSPASSLVTFTTLSDAPDKPLNVATSNVQTDSVRVTWEAPAILNGNIAKYVIHVEENHVSNAVGWTVNVSNKPESFRVEKLTQLTQYGLWIVAVNVRETDGKELKGPPSAIVNFTTPGGPRTVPKNVRSSVTGVSAVITWQPPVYVPRADNWEYRFVVVKNVGRFPVVVSKSILPPKTKATVMNLMPHTQYKVEIAVSLSGTRSQLSTHYFTTKQTEPGRPRQVKISKISSKSALVSWSPPRSLNGIVRRYRIFLQTGNDKTPSKSATGYITVSSSHNQAVVDRLTLSTEYYVWVAAINVEQEVELISELAGPIPFTTKQERPSSPRDVRVINGSITSTSAPIQWQRPQSPNGVISYYYLNYSARRPGSDTEVQTVKSNDTRVHLIGLLPFTEYAVQVVAVNVEDATELRSAASPVTTFTTLSDAPSKPQNVKTSEVQNTSAKVAWEPPARLNGVIAKYVIYVTQVSKSNWKTSEAVGTDRHATVTGLIQLTQYEVKIVAVNVRKTDGKELRGPPSRVVHFITLGGGKSAPRNIRSNVSSVSAVITWEPPKRVPKTIQWYRVSCVNVSDNPKKTFYVDYVDAKQRKMVLSNLVPHTQYRVKIVVLLSDMDPLPAFHNFTTDQSYPTPPVSLRSTYILSRSARIQWGLPRKSHGEIQFYVVSLYISKAGDTVPSDRKSSWMVIRSQRTKNGSRDMELSALSPYTLYGVSVSAVNVMNEVELRGNETALIHFTTKDEVPTTPSNCSVTETKSTVIDTVWQPPKPFDYRVAFYIFNYTSEKQPRTSSRILNSKTLHAQVSGLLPFTDYNISISASTNNTELLTGPPCFIRTKTAVGVPPTPAKPRLDLNATQIKGTVVLNLPTLNETNGPISFVEVIIVELKVGVPWFENTSLPVDEDNRVVSKSYIKLSSRRLVLNTSEEGNDVVLKPKTTYAFYVRWIAEQDKTSQNRLQSTASLPALYTTPETETLTTSGGESSTVHVIAAVVTCILAVILVVIVILWLRRRKRTVLPKTPNKNSYGLNFTAYANFPQNTGKNTNDFPVYDSYVMETAGNSRAIIEEFEQHVEKLKAHDNEGFVTEFEEMAEVGTEQSTVYATSAENRHKNRYRNIVPYDGHCLMLDEVDGMDILETDYINATYIDGFNRSKEYIVAQAPVSHTCADFWRMIWIEKVEAIVMLTKLVESGKEKCSKYWSDDDKKEYEGLIIEVELQNEMANFAVRKIRIQLLNEVRHVTHYHFLSWPDHGVPTYATDLLGLIHQVRRDTGTSNAPLVVHCSAGVGRSGAYITIDILLSAIESNRSIDVNSTVRRLRMQRMQMVQSEMQYILIHEAVLEACYTRKTAISTANFAKEFAKLQDFEEEFSRLIKLARPLDKSDFKVGSLPTVLRRKNREPLFIPPDSVRVVLHLDDDSADADYVNTEEGADYINASYINGYCKRNFFIVTQAPLPSTVTDMWKMVFQQNVTAIVNLAQPDEYEQYWPSSGSESYGQLRVNWLSEGTRKAFTVYKMQLIKRKSARDIALFHYHCWSGTDAVPSDVAGLMEMISQLEQWQRKTQGNRIIVHCRTGMGRSGVFCAVYNVLDQTKSEGIANVMHMTKVLLNQRPGIIDTAEQYEGIYSIANSYLQEEVTYANTK